MCGITGILDMRAPGPIDRALLTRMNDVQSHRGPDGSGIHIEPGVGLGHRRLSIIDLTGGAQPLFNEDGTVAVTFNGEIYNFAELMRELEAHGHVFRTRCDTEVIVHAWEQWGTECVTRFSGMFAFALWDRNKRCLFLARDRLGKKPLYYAALPNGQLVFSSELKGLLVNPAVPRQISQRAVEDYFAFGYVPDPETIFTGVKKLPPATTLLVEQGGSLPSPREYWSLDMHPREDVNADAAREELIARLRAAVKARMVADVPLGAFLSGGVDSSAVVAMMAGLSDKPVRTCSISFGDPKYNESEYARSVANRYGTDHEVRQVYPDELDLLDQLAGMYDEPFADSSAIPTYRVCALARSSVTVALSGDGGDENFAGYKRYRWFMKEQPIRDLIPDVVRAPLFGTLGHVYPKMEWAPRALRVKATFQSLARDALESYFSTVAVSSGALRSALFSDSLKSGLQSYRAIDTLHALAEHAPADDPLSLVQYLDFKTYLPGDILVKVDRASMANSLEVRVPLLDHSLVEWAAHLPPGLKLHGDQGKYLFKRALEPYLGNDILYRPKQGFAVPLASWFRGPLRERVDATLRRGALPESGFFSPPTLARIADEHARGQNDHSNIIWALLMFDGFLRKTN
jgi:asparagine synthase (glutamine-hydrolysing)